MTPRWEHSEFSYAERSAQMEFSVSRHDADLGKS